MPANDPPTPRHNRWLVAAATLSALAAVAHLACIVIGADAYRFLGAGEAMARLAAAGDPHPTRVTLAIAAVLFAWSAYALSGAGVIARLPLLRPALYAITGVYLARGLGFVLLMPRFPDNSLTFWIVSSGLCLGIGGVHLLGLRAGLPAARRSV